MKYDFDLNIEEENSLTKIIRQIKPGSTVLEFGPAAGRMTRYLAEKMNCKVYIVEIDPESAEHAMKYSEDCIVGDIEQYEWINKWENISFDYITFADVLEHLRDPQAVLTKTKLLLKEDGEVLFSVPNVAHNALLINLYNNVFNYTPVGLLDNTHIHLFAYNTLKEVCHYAGYVPIVEDAVYSDVGENEVSASYQHVESDVERVLKNRIYNNVYQFVFTLKKQSYVKMHETEIRRSIITRTNDYKFQVFFDMGNGWCEENSTVIMFNPNIKNKFVVDVTSGIEIKQIRIDPIDRQRFVELVAIRKILNDGSKEEINLEKVTSNATFRAGNFFYFQTDDPNLYIEDISLEGVQKLEITMNFISSVDNGYFAGLKDINCKLEMREADFEKLKGQLIDRQNELNNKQNELNNKQSELNNKQSELDEVRNLLKLANEELDRRMVELNHRMDVINQKDKDINELVNKCEVIGKENVINRNEKERLEAELQQIKKKKLYKLIAQNDKNSK